MDISILLSLGAFVIAALSGIVALSKRKSEIDANDATAADKLSAAWERLNKPNQDRITLLELELNRAFRRIRILEGILKDHNIPLPPDDDDDTRPVPPTPTVPNRGRIFGL